MHADDFRIRIATNADCAAVRAVVFAALREHGLTPEPDGADLDLFDFQKHYHQRGGRFDVLEDGDRTIVGSVGLYPIEPRTVELRKMYLAAECRGLGLGRRLLDHAIAEARVLGFKAMMLETASPLKTAIALYEKFGFKRSENEIHTRRCDQVFELTL